jgi:hypothetical protein
MECGDGVHDDETKQYGNWVMAPVEDWHPQSLGVRFRAPTADGGARGGGRGGGRGRGSRTDSRKRPPAESPPNKGVAGSEGNGTLAITDGSEVRENHPTARLT